MGETARLGLALLFVASALGCSKLRHASESNVARDNDARTAPGQSAPAADPTPAGTVAGRTIEDEPKVLLEVLSNTMGAVSFVTDKTDLYFDDDGFVYRGDHPNGPQKLGEAPGNILAIDRDSMYFFDMGSDEPHVLPSLIRLDRKSWKERWRVTIPEACMGATLVRGFIGCAFYFGEQWRFTHGSVDLYSVRDGKRWHLADTGPTPSLGAEGNTVCWTSKNENRITCRDLAARTTKTLRGTPVDVWELAVSGTTVVYINREQIGAVDIATGRVRVLADRGASMLVLDRTHAYVLLHGPILWEGAPYHLSVARVPLRGGPLQEMIVPDGVLTLDIGATRTDVYVQVSDRLHSHHIIRGPKEPDGPGPIRPGEMPPDGSQPKVKSKRIPLLPDAASNAEKSRAT